MTPWTPRLPTGPCRAPGCDHGFTRHYSPSHQAYAQRICTTCTGTGRGLEDAGEYNEPPEFEMMQALLATRFEFLAGADFK